MQRRQFSRGFKLEAVKLIKERGVSVAQAARDLDVHENVLRKWVRQVAADPAQALRASRYHAVLLARCRRKPSALLPGPIAGEQTRRRSELLFVSAMDFGGGSCRLHGCE